MERMTVKKLLHTARRFLVKPEFSILIPLDGSETPDVVEKTLRSALNQSLRNIEVIVAHMKAGQDTIERLESLRDRDTRIRLYRVSRPHDNQYATVLTGAASIARGRYMLPLHCPARLERGVLGTIHDRAVSEGSDLVLVTPTTGEYPHSLRLDDDPELVAQADLNVMAWTKNLWDRKSIAPLRPYWTQERALELLAGAERVSTVADRLTNLPETPCPVSSYPVGASISQVHELSDSIARRQRLITTASAESRRAVACRWLGRDLAPWMARLRESPPETEIAVQELVRTVSQGFTESDWLKLPFWDRLLSWAITEGVSSDIDEIIIARRVDSNAVPLRLVSDGLFEVEAGVLQRITAPPWATRLSAADLTLIAQLWDIQTDGDARRITVSAYVPGVNPIDLPEPTFSMVSGDTVVKAPCWEHTHVEGVDLRAHDPWRTYMESGFYCIVEGSLPDRILVSVRINDIDLFCEVPLPRPALPREEPVVNAFSIVDDSAVFEGTVGIGRPFDVWLESSTDSRRLTVEATRTGWCTRLELTTTLPRGGYFLRWGACGADAPSGWCRAAEGFAYHPLRLVGENLGVEVARRAGDHVGVVLSPPVPSEEWSRYGQQQVASRPVPPVRRGVFFDSFGGRNAGDSPGALCRALIAAGCDAPLWFAVVDRRISVPEGAVPVVVGTSQWYDVMRSARVIVSNNHLPPWFSKQSGQYWVQTWHGTPIKRLLRDAPREFIPVTYRRVMDRQVPQWDLLLAQNRRTEADMRSSTGYEGEVRVGELPRNARLLDARADDIRTELGIAPDAFVVLYAPTWRDADQSEGDHYRVLVDPSALAAQTGVTVLARSHHMSGVHSIGEGVVDVSAYPHVEDLMCAADALVTDYSSILFDFALTGKPTILHVPDLEWYRDVERGFYREWPADSSLPVTRTIAELTAEVRKIRRGGRTPLSVDDAPITKNVSWLVDRILRMLNV